LQEKEREKTEKHKGQTEKEKTDAPNNIFKINNLLTIR